MRFKQNAVLTAAVYCCLFSGASRGDSVAAPPGGVADDADGAGLAEITVTAERRRENLQDVPVAVTALSNEFLTENHVRSLQDLAATVPGLVVTNSVNYGSAPLSIRGVGGANGGGNVLSDEPVAVYVDDAVVSRLRFSTAALIDVDSIEVLRGPQGTLYGRNSPAGAVVIHSAEPTAAFTAHATADYASFDSHRIEAAASGPLNEGGTLLGRIAGGFGDSAGWGENAVGGPNLNRGRGWQIRGFVRFEPNPDLHVDVIADASEQLSYPGVIAVSNTSNLASAANPTGSNVVFPYVPQPGLQNTLGHDQFASNFPTFTQITGQNLTARLTWNLPTAQLTSISNYRAWNMHGQQDSDGTAVVPPTPLFVVGVIPNVGDNNGRFVDSQASEELRLASAGSGPFVWTVGAYVFHEDNAVDPINIYNRLAGPGGDGTDAAFTAWQTTNSFAGFFDGGYQFTDTLKLDAGARLTDEHKSVLDSFAVTTINAFVPPGPVNFPAGTPLVPYNVVTGSRTDHNFSPRVVLNDKLTPDTLVYASFSEGFLSGGFNAFRGTNFEFEPEKIRAYEIGLKTDIDKALRFDAAAFHYDYFDLQVRTPVASGGVDIQSAQRARVQGLEFESTWNTPLRGLSFNANATLLDARFLEGSLTAIAVPSWVFGTNPPVVQENVAGNRLTRAPKVQYAITARYEVSLGSAKASVDADVRHQSSEYFLETEQQQPTFQGAAWSEYDARLNLADASDRWRVSLYGRNLADNRHFTQITAFFGLPNGAVNDPRSFGVELAVKY
jgi:iron complex outermembrane receptor protein